MKLSFSTLPCEGWTLDELVEACRRHGYTGIELKEDRNYAITIDSTESELREAAAKFENAGITVTNIGSRVRFTGDEQEGEQQTECKQRELRTNIDIAQQLSARGVRIMLGKGSSRPDRSALSRQRILRRIREACDYAASRQVEIWIETHSEYSTRKILRELLDEVDRPNCKVIYDILHAYEFHEKAIETITYLGADCVHVHVKDGKPDADPDKVEWHHTELGKGQLPITEAVKTLQSCNYRGYFSFEWEDKWRQELRDLALDKQDVLAAYVEFMRNLSGRGYR